MLKAQIVQKRRLGQPRSLDRDRGAGAFDERPHLIVQDLEHLGLVGDEVFPGAPPLDDRSLPLSPSQAQGGELFSHRALAASRRAEQYDDRRHLTRVRAIRAHRRFAGTPT